MGERILIRFETLDGYYYRRVQPQDLLIEGEYQSG